jgi:hypothetical protein
MTFLIPNLLTHGPLKARWNSGNCRFLAMGVQSAEASPSNSQYSCRYRPELGLVLKDVSMTIVRSDNMAISFLC